jgi:hypothetical protein
VTSFDSTATGLNGLAAQSFGWVSDGVNTTVYVNSSNAAETTTAGATYTADMEIFLAGVTTLTQSDFIV